jgi:hypothetical protein
MCPDKCKIELFETNYGIVLECELEDTPRSKGQKAELIFDDIPIRSASAKGFKTANRPISKFLKKKRGTEKPPEDEVVEEVDTAEEEEAKTRKAMGWKSKTPIRLTAPDPQEEIEEVIEEPVKDSKKMFLKTSANKDVREIPEPEPVKDEPEAKAEDEEETREIPEPEPIQDKDVVTEEETSEKQAEEVEEVSDEEAQDQTEETESEAKEETSEEQTEETQAELDLPKESGTRRYLIDEDNPFMLEP